MNADGRTTSEQLYIPTLLVVGAEESLLVRCYHAARTTGLAIRRCEIDEVAVTIPRRHPLAIVAPMDVFVAAAHELAALARDVRSVLLPVDPQVSVRELEAMIAGAIDGGLSQRERRDGAGRYSIVDGVEEEAPFSRRSAPPPTRSSTPPSLRSPGPPSMCSSTPPSSIRPVQLRATGTSSPGIASTRPAVTVPPAPVRSATLPGPASIRPSTARSSS